MTESKNEQGSEPGRPSWAAGLDLSPEMYRAEDELLQAQVGSHKTSHWVLRRLADAEMRVAELERALPQRSDRGEPDFLIDRDGDMFRRVGGGVYWLQGGGGVDWRRDEMTEPVQELWT